MSFQIEKAHQPDGLCTSIANDDIENFSVMLGLINLYLGKTVLERATRTEQNWEEVTDLPMDFATYRYRVKQGTKDGQTL